MPKANKKGLVLNASTKPLVSYSLILCFKRCLNKTEELLG